MIVSGSESQAFGAALAVELGESLAAVEYEEFANGEQLVCVPESAGRAIIVASTISDAAHIQLLQLQDAVSQWADDIITVLPYMGYARQEMVFREGEPVSARAMARAISTGTDRVLTVNPHEEIVCDYFDVPCESIDAAPRLAEPLGELLDPLFVAPDAGASDLAVAVRDVHGAGETSYFEKHRISDTEVEVQPSDASTTGRDVVIVDDSLETGSTMSTAINQLEEPCDVYVACVHPLLVDNARTKLANTGVTAIFGTDTVERSVSVVSAAPAVAPRL